MKANNERTRQRAAGRRADRRKRKGVLDCGKSRFRGNLDANQESETIEGEGGRGRLIDTNLERKVRFN